MKMPMKATRGTHSLKIAGRQATIGFDTWNTDPWLTAIAAVTAAKKEFNAGGINALLDEDAERRNGERIIINDDGGIPTPSVKPGDVTAPGLGGGGDWEDLIRRLGLDPADPMHYDEVELSIGSALPALAPKIAKNPVRGRSSVSKVASQCPRFFATSRFN